MQSLKKVTTHAIVCALTCAAVTFLSGFTTLDKTDYTLTVRAGSEEYVFAYPEIDFCRGLLYLKNLDGVVERIYLDTLKKPTDATVSFNPTSKQKFSFTNEVFGEEIDKNALYRTISNAIAKKIPSVTIPLQKTTPCVTLDFLKEHTSLRGEFKTSYEYSPKGRKQNVKLCAEIINGATLWANEVFSFNLRVGERTYDRGFTDAKIITEGKFVDGVGGGVCQVSSTLYNCALLSGLNVIERHQHTLAVSYVEPSFDAMVNYGGCDLKFLNDTDGPIFIECVADGNLLTFRIYGKRKNFTVKRCYTVLKSESPGMEIVEDETGELCGELEEKVVIQPKNAIQSIGFLEYYDGNKFLKKISLGKSNYGGIKGVIAKKPPISHKNDDLIYNNT